MRDLRTVPLSSNDRGLVKAATSMILRRAKYGHHHAACALRTVDGRTFLGLHISANFGTGSICAEAATIAESLKRKTARIDRIVTVRHTFVSEPRTEVVPPCGRCRELILQHGPNAGVILEGSSGLVLVNIGQLLPMPFQRRRRQGKDARR